MALPLLLFTLSGVVALIYQVSWTRMLYPAFGMQLSAITAVVATFLAGLGLGSRLFGPMADRTNPWKLYAGLEIGIGLWGLAMPSLTGAAVWVLPSLGSSQLVRVAGAAVLLVVPCMLMGGTFPAFARGYRRESTSLGRDLGLLYALNTIGGAMGCMAAGNWLLPHYAMDSIVWGGALANFAIGIAILKLAPGYEQGSPSRLDSVREEPPGDGLLLGVLFLTGWLSLSYELLWTRALTQVLMATTASYSLALSALLLGITLGSFLYRRLLAGRDSPGLLTWMTLLLTVSAATSFLLLPWLSSIHLSLTTALGGTFWPSLGLSLLAFAPTATLFGATFPLCLERMSREGGLGARLGLAYAVNTLGSVLGAVVTGIYALDWLASGGTLLALLGLSLVMVGLAFQLDEPGPSRRLAGAVALVTLVGLPFYPRGLFFENQYQVLSRVLPPPLKVIHRGEDATSMASVVEIEKAFFHYVDPTRAEPVLVRHRDIFHSNWRGVGGTGIYLWNVTGAYLASHLHPEPRKVLLIGYGSGRLLTTLLRLDRAHSIEVAEINRQNFVNSSHLYLDAERALSDPRVSVTVTDGRNFLLLARERKYEVIVVDVGGLSGEGTEFFYTQEFLELCRQRLEPDGIVMTWMGLGQLTARPGWSYQKTMASVFDEVTLWWGTREMSSSGYLWVVGANQPLEVDYAQLEQTWGDLEEFQRQELALAGLEGPEDFASLFATRVADPVPRHLSEARILTDLHPHHPVHGRGKERVDPGSRTAGMNHLLNANRRLPVSGAPARVVQRRQQFLQTLNQRYTGERYE